MQFGTAVMVFHHKVTHHGYGEIKYGYFVDDSLDISNDTALLQPHGGDIFGNIYDWKRVSSIEK